MWNAGRGRREGRVRTQPLNLAISLPATWAGLRAAAVLPIAGSSQGIPSPPLDLRACDKSAREFLGGW